MEREKLFVFGAGGHGKVIADIFESSNKKVTAFVDENIQGNLKKIFSIPVISLKEFLERDNLENSQIFIAVGDNKIRREKFYFFEDKGYKIPNAIHNNSIISKHSDLSTGICIMSGSCINPGVTIEKGVIINTGSTIDHDCILKEFSQISPGVNLAGNVTINENVFLGTGSVVIPGKTIGKNSVIGAGSVIISDIPENVKVVGNPGKIIKASNN